MITEKIIAKEFNGLWEETLPLLTSSFVKLFNAANNDDLTEYPRTKFKNIPIGPNVEKHDLVAELSFQLAKTSAANSKSIIGTSIRNKIFNDAYTASISFLKKYEKEAAKIALNTDEVKEAIDLAAQYEAFFEHIKAKNIQFSPKIAGSGFLGVCEADLSVDDTLYEVKTVSRNIAGKDLKQLIIYLALQYSTGSRRWFYAGFFNPRKSMHYKFSVDHLIYRTSGGRSTSEVFKDIIDFLSNRGIEIDAVF